MKALVEMTSRVSGAWTDVPDAKSASPTDAIVRVDAVTICGTDLQHTGSGSTSSEHAYDVFGNAADTGR